MKTSGMMKTLGMATMIITLATACMEPSGTPAGPRQGAGCAPKAGSNSYGLVETVPATDLWLPVQKTLRAKCVGCHQGYDVYATAKAKGSEFVRLVNLNKGTQGFMPQGGDKLAASDLKAFADWKAAGYPATPTTTGSGAGTTPSPTPTPVTQCQ